jgi:hypothetical protein
MALGIGRHAVDEITTQAIGKAAASPLELRSEDFSNKR